MIATITNGAIFISTNSGVSWGFTPRDPGSFYWYVSIACSADGTNLIFASGRNKNGAIYSSTNFGTTWTTSNVPHECWTSVASSSDGNVLLAGATNSIYFTTNMGGIWTPANVPTNQYWISVSCSADASLMTAVATNGLVCVSTNTGDNWFTNSTINLNSDSVVMMSGHVPKPEDGNNSSATNWQAVACSADKTKVVAVVYGGPICISTDSGATWTASTNAPYTNWEAVASSADGTKLAAVINGGSIYTSADSGAIWVSNNVPNTNWVSIASSADGCTLAAAYNNGIHGYSMFYLHTTPTPHLNLAVSSNNLAFSWIKPSTNFVIQQNSDLSSGNWVTLTNTSTLNLSNLQDQVTFSPTNSSGFFRLISQ